MKWMCHALALGRQGRVSCAPNPMVGCVVVKENRIVGQGYHHTTGGPHAEVIALSQANESARGSDVFVTLEPCSHQGRTPPCADALVKAGIKRVYVAIKDPNPLVAGSGIEKLRKAGIEVCIGPCQEEAYQLNQDFFHYITSKRPYVIAKWAMTLDGKIATSQGKSKWITSEEARAHAHMIRSQVCGIVVGGNTLRIDNPQLTVRNEMPCASIRQPRPIVITKFGNINLNSAIFEGPRKPLIIMSDQVANTVLQELKFRNIDYHLFPLQNQKFRIVDILEVLGEKYQQKSILVEGGNQILTSFHEEKLINQIYAYIAPKIMGGGKSLTPVGGDDVECVNGFHQLHSQAFIPLGPDLCMMAKTAQTPRLYEDFLHV